MAPGADKRLFFDPPGAIGLVDPEPVLLVQFNEQDTATRPKDAHGVMQDFDIASYGLFTTNVMPDAVDGVLGRARQFDGSTMGLDARDLESGATLLTRDCSIQVVLTWDAAAQDLQGSAGVIASRGLGSSSAEGVCYCIQLAVVDAPSYTASFQWVWQDVGGTTHVQTGENVTLPPGQFTMLTATRRWVSPTEVVLRYYVGDLLLGEVTSTDGSIGGGTTGRFQIGYRSEGSPGFYFAGAIDELLVVGRELTHEEIENTWLRITSYQPLGVQLFTEMHDPGFPLPLDPASDPQLETRLIGQGLGYAAAAIENFRANALPGRSYGQVLVDWETVVRVTPAPSSGIDEQRARVVARMRQRRGVSIGGLEDALVGLLGGASNDDLEFLAFTNDVEDDFTTLNLLRWDVTPAASFTAVAGSAHAAPGAGTFLMNGTTRNWVTCTQDIGGDGRTAHHFAKLAFTTPRSTSEVGIYFGERTQGNYLLLGLRDNAGTFVIVTESFQHNVSQGLVTRATLGANPAALWLHLYQTDTQGTWKAAWSITSASAGFTTSGNITHPTLQNLSGLYLRSTGAIAAPVADFDSSRTRAPFGTRSFDAYVLLDSALGFTPDVDGAHSVIQAIKHAYTEGTFITSRELLCDTPFGCDRGPMGGI